MIIGRIALLFHRNCVTLHPLSYGKDRRAGVPGHGTTEAGSGAFPMPSPVEGNDERKRSGDTFFGKQPFRQAGSSFSLKAQDRLYGREVQGRKAATRRRDGRAEGGHWTGRSMWKSWNMPEHKSGQKIMKKGLVLEGGAMRGLFSAGVMDVLMENGIAPDGVIGVSAGAAFGCNMKSRQPGRVLRYNQKLAHDWRYASLRSLLTTGDYFGGEYAYHYVPRHVDYFDVDAFRENPMEFWAVCTNVGTGKAEYRQLKEVDDECLEYIRASASMPIAARIVTVDGRKLLDGGIADSIPLRFFQGQGYACNLVVLTQPEGFVKTPNPLMPLMRIWLRRHPRIVRALEQRHVMYNAELDYVREEEKKPNTLVLRPKGKLAIGHISHDPAEMQATYDQGRETALENLEKIKELFA